MSLDLDHLLLLTTQHDRVARITIAKSKGSVPRVAGTSMVVWQHGQSGTIGGGRLEWEAAKFARKALKSSNNMISDVPLGPALGQCCGGHVTLVTEVFTRQSLAELRSDQGLVTRRITGNATLPFGMKKALASARQGQDVAPIFLEDGWLQEITAPQRTPLWIWGAGHVGRALVATISPLPEAQITWFDTSLDRFPADQIEGVRCIPTPELSAACGLAPTDAHHLIVTYSHAIDLELCHQLLRHGFGKAGLIGSTTKWARFQRRLGELGHSPAQIARIACPIGDPALGKHPQAIAIGVASDFLKSLNVKNLHESVAV